MTLYGIEKSGTGICHRVQDTGFSAGVTLYPEPCVAVQRVTLYPELCV